MGRLLMRYAEQSGLDLIGAFDRNQARQGLDIAEVSGAPSRGITIQPPSELEEFLTRHRPDCVVVATRSLLAEVEDELRICARLGIDVVTTCDEAIYPWNSSPALTAELDELAIQNGATLTGSGFPDLGYCHMVTTLAAAVPGLHKVAGVSLYNADDYGPALADHHGVGFPLDRVEQEILAPERLSPEERDALIAAGTFVPSPMWNANGWLASRLGLDVVSQVQESTPIVVDQDVFSKTLDRVIPAGDCIGLRTEVRTQTAQGVLLQTANIGKIYLPGETDTNEWTLTGEADISYAMTDIATSEIVCQMVISRVFDCAEAPAGFVTTDRLPAAKPVSFGSGPARACLLYA